MKNNCTASVTPQLIEDKCKGKQTSTDCVIFEKIITYFNLPKDSTLTVVIENLLLSLVDSRNRITSLEALIQNLEARIVTLEQQ